MRDYAVAPALPQSVWQAASIWVSVDDVGRPFSLARSPLKHGLWGASGSLLPAASAPLDRAMIAPHRNKARARFRAGVDEGTTLFGSLEPNGLCDTSVSSQPLSRGLCL